MFRRFVFRLAAVVMLSCFGSPTMAIRRLTITPCGDRWSALTTTVPLVQF